MILTIVSMLCTLMMYLVILGASRGNDRRQEDLEQMAFLQEYQKRRKKQSEQ